MARHVRGRSFADVGCMWSVDGAIAFAAEAAGATAVTGVDVMEESAAYRAQHEHLASQARFVRGDLHDPATVEAVGPGRGTGPSTCRLFAPGGKDRRLDEAGAVASEGCT